MLGYFRSECYYEKPYAGKLHVRFCEGLVSRGTSLLDFRCTQEDLIDIFHHSVYTMYIPNIRRFPYASTSKRMGK